MSIGEDRASWRADRLVVSISTGPLVFASRATAGSARDAFLTLKGRSVVRRRNARLLESIARAEEDPLGQSKRIKRCSLG